MSSVECYPDKAPKVDQLLDTLSNDLRRELIHYFETVATADTVPLAEAVSHIDRRVPSTTPTQLRNSLHHTHLPKLKERGWIAYDSRTGDIHYHGKENAEQLLTEVTEVFAK